MIENSEIGRDWERGDETRKRTYRSDRRHCYVYVLRPTSCSESPRRAEPSNELLFSSESRLSRYNVELLTDQWNRFRSDTVFISGEMKLPARTIHHGGQRPTSRYEKPCQLRDPLRESRE